MTVVNRNATPGPSRAIEVIEISDDDEDIPHTRAPCRRRRREAKPIDLTVDSDKEVDAPAPTTLGPSWRALGKRPAFLEEETQRSTKVKRLHNAEPLFIDLSDDDEDQFQRPPRRQRYRTRNINGPPIYLTIDSDGETLGGNDETGLAMAKLLGEDFLLQEEQERKLQESFRRAEKLNVEQQQADAELALRLAEEEEKEFGKVIQQVQSKSEGIVFKVVIDTETNLLEDGSPAHPDDLARFEPWKAKLKTFGVKVKRFHWIVNYELEKRFEESRDILRDICGEEPQELQLFHGTGAENIDSILNNGFRIGGLGGHAIMNGAALGYGVYLATDPNQSLGYARGASRMFACRVLPGRSTNSAQYTRTLPTIPVGSGQFETFATPNVYVVRHSQLVLPCYMIEFESLNNLYGPFVNMGALALPPAVPLLPAMPVGGWGGPAMRGLLMRAMPPPPLPPPARVRPARRQKMVATATEGKRRSERLRVKAEA